MSALLAQTRARVSGDERGTVRLTLERRAGEPQPAVAAAWAGGPLQLEALADSCDRVVLVGDPG